MPKIQRLDHFLFATFHMSFQCPFSDVMKEGKVSNACTQYRQCGKNHPVVIKLDAPFCEATKFHLHLFKSPNEKGAFKRLLSTLVCPNYFLWWKCCKKCNCSRLNNVQALEIKRVGHLPLLFDFEVMV